MASINPNLLDRNPHGAETFPARTSSLRRPTREQGMALEAVAHAIEYLIDSRACEAKQYPGEASAVQILIHKSRNIFRECAPVVPLSLRLRRWMVATINGQQPRATPVDR